MTFIHWLFPLILGCESSEITIYMVVLDGKSSTCYVLKSQDFDIIFVYVRMYVLFQVGEEEESKTFIELESIESQVYMCVHI